MIRQTVSAPRLLTLGLCAAVFSFAGCRSQQNEQGRVTTATHRHPRQSQAMRGQQSGMTDQMNEQNMRTASLAYPTGDQATSSLLLTKRAPRQIMAGQKFKYQIEVKNLTDHALNHVVVYEQQPHSVKGGQEKGKSGQAGQAGQTDQADQAGQAGQVDQADGQADGGGQPQPDQSPSMQPKNEKEAGQGDVQPDTSRAGGGDNGNGPQGRPYRIGMLGPNQTKTITVQGAAGQVGQLRSCTTVDYTPTLCMTTQVIQPALSIQRAAPQQADACDTITLHYKVANTGSGDANNVVVSEQLPEGLTTAQGNQRQVQFHLDRLAAGQTHEFSVETKAQGPGKLTSQAMAQAAGGLKAQSQQETTVVQAPVLKVGVQAPKRGFTQRPLAYTIRVANTGDAPARRLVVRARLPQGATQVQANYNGQVQNNQVVWNIGRPLPPQKQYTLKLNVTSNEPARMTTRVSADAQCAKAAQAQVRTRLVGIPAVLLEVVDQHDPVQLGRNTAYQITVTNQGTAQDTHVQVVATLPKQEQFVSAGGDARFKHQGNEVTFRIPSIQAGATKTLRVTAKATAPGDVRFRAQLTSDNLSSPVNETEATRLFGNEPTEQDMRQREPQSQSQSQTSPRLQPSSPAGNAGNAGHVGDEPGTAQPGDADQDAANPGQSNGDNAS